MTTIFRSSPADEEKYKFSPTFHAVTAMSLLERVGDDGFIFHASGKVTGMVDANVDDFLLVTPASPEVHLTRFSMAAAVCVRNQASGECDAWPRRSRAIQ